MSARLNAAAAPAEHVGDTTGELASLRLALEDADILAGEACSMITALARAARRHLSSPTTASVDETLQLLKLIDEKSNYLRDGLASELRPRLQAAAIPDGAGPTDAGGPAAVDEFVPCAERIKLAHGATHGMDPLLDLIIQQSVDADSLAVHELACRAAQLNSLAMSALGDYMETLDSLRGRRLDLYRFSGTD